MLKALSELIKRFELNRRIGDLDPHDVRLEAELQTIRAATSFKPERNTLPTTHLINHPKHLPARIYRDSLRRSLGIPARKAEALMALLKTENQEQQAQTAAKHGLSLNEVRELLAAHAIAFPNQFFPER